ncbi:MAG: DNA cytosine methyltransferase [Chitinivibrionia bacterium]|nr:DNA cytosine methyltransferase [Chitinivibrionia bacterium]
MIKYVSLFSGIEAAKVAFDTANIPAAPLAFFEIEKQQSKLLAEKYPETPNYGDVCKFDFSIFKGKANFVCGGSPCQSFSMANLINRDFSGSKFMLEFVRAIWEIEPDYFLFENVPQAQAVFNGRFKIS